MRRTQAKTKRAVHRADKTARTQNYCKPFYCQDHTPSIENLKMQLGEFLCRWLNQNQRDELRQSFEAKLRQFIDLKYTGVR